MSKKEIAMNAAELDGLLLQEDDQVVRDVLEQLRAEIIKKSKPKEIQSAVETLQILWEFEPDDDFPETTSIKLDGPLLDAIILSPPDYLRVHLSALRRIIRQASDPQEKEEVLDGIRSRRLARALGFSNLEIALGVKGARRRERRSSRDNEVNSTDTSSGD